MQVDDAAAAEPRQPQRPKPRMFERDGAGRPWPHPLHRHFGRYATTATGAALSVGGGLVSAAALSASSNAALIGGAAGVGLSGTVALLTAAHGYATYAHPLVLRGLHRVREA